MGNVVLVTVPQIAHAPTQYCISQQVNKSLGLHHIVLITYLVIYHVIYYVGVVVRRQVVKNIWSVRLPKKKKNKMTVINHLCMILGAYETETL